MFLSMETKYKKDGYIIGKDLRSYEDIKDRYFYYKHILRNGR